MIIPQDKFEFSGVCPLAAIVIFHGKINIGTFCGDGSYTLPLNQNILIMNRNHSKRYLTVIVYGMSPLSTVEFEAEISWHLEENNPVVLNPCQTCSQAPDACYTRNKILAPLNSWQYQLFYTYKDHNCMPFVIQFDRAIIDKKYYLTYPLRSSLQILDTLLSFTYCLRYISIKLR